MIVTRWLENWIEISRKFTKKEKKLTITMIKVKQYQDI